METDPLRQGWQAFAFSVCSRPSLHFSWRVQELGSHWAKRNGSVCDNVSALLHTAHIPLHPFNSYPQGPSKYLVFLFPDTGKLSGQHVDLSLESFSRSSLKGLGGSSGSQRTMSSLKAWSSGETSVTECQTYSRTKLGAQGFRPRYHTHFSLCWAPGESHWACACVHCTLSLVLPVSEILRLWAPLSSWDGWLRKQSAKVEVLHTVTNSFQGEAWSWFLSPKGNPRVE